MVEGWVAEGSAAMFWVLWEVAFNLVWDNFQSFLLIVITLVSFKKLIYLKMLILSGYRKTKQSRFFP